MVTIVDSLVCVTPVLPNSKNPVAFRRAIDHQKGSKMAILDLDLAIKAYIEQYERHPLPTEMDEIRQMTLAIPQLVSKADIIAEWEHRYSSDEYEKGQFI